MNSLFGRLQGKLQEARISEVNHELGKVKESIVTESSAYWNSIRSSHAAAAVGSLIRSESTRFSQLLGRGHGDVRRKGSLDDDDVEEDDHATGGGIPKSVSLPTITKYKYKSSAGEVLEKSAADREADADKFIKVLEKKVEQGGLEESDVCSSASNRRVTHRAAASTREEIRRKLALFGSEEEEEEAKEEEKPKESDLEVCFINEAVDEDDEEECHSAGAAYKHREDSSEDEAAATEGCAEDGGEEDEKARAALRRRLSQLHRELRVNLSDCKSIARAHVEKERARRRRECPLRPLVGFGAHEVTADRLSRCGVAALQVVAEHFHAQIERLNEELVTALMTKDELEIEQDSQLLDVEDLTHSISKSST